MKASKVCSDELKHFVLNFHKGTVVSESHIELFEGSSTCRMLIVCLATDWLERNTPRMEVLKRQLEKAHDYTSLAEVKLQKK
jgi:hypothetical protein